MMELTLWFTLWFALKILRRYVRNKPEESRASGRQTFATCAFSWVDQARASIALADWK